MKSVVAVLFLLMAMAMPALADAEILSAADEWPVVAENQSQTDRAPDALRSRWTVIANPNQDCKLGPCNQACEEWTYVSNSVCRTASDGVTRECVSDSNGRECAKMKDPVTGLLKCQTCIN
ncbi:MAG TPA: hypothetical protein VEK57_01305 [Thermoanaerobaculia bacterium]|nr:hypothetical protein [Thermoanaerobaculia bacterium]